MKEYMQDVSNLKECCNCECEEGDERCPNDSDVCSSSDECADDYCNSYGSEEPVTEGPFKRQSTLSDKDLLSLAEALKTLTSVGCLGQNKEMYKHVSFDLPIEDSKIIDKLAAKYHLNTNVEVLRNAYLLFLSLDTALALGAKIFVEKDADRIPLDSLQFLAPTKSHCDYCEK